MATSPQNIAESLNAWLLEACEKPIIPMLEQIHHQLMEWFVARREMDQNTEGILVSSAAKNIKTTLTMYARRYRIIEANGDIYEVFSPETISTYVVRLDTETCTCCQWQMSGIPCGHALAVSLERRDDPQTYAKGFYRLDAYRGTYSNSIFPPNVNAADINTANINTANINNTAVNLATVNPVAINPATAAGSAANMVEPFADFHPAAILLPPNVHCPPGRPKKQRIRGAIEGGPGGRAQGVFHCT